ncbi:MAG: MATE family efflux transporter [Verrucomicrobiales bacterium]|nr:MATE family efflux transporter [Verrucomicrobiota bacterium JB025]
MDLTTESRSILRLALPLMIGQLSQMLLGVADTVMVGRLGVTELATLTFANALFHIPFVFGIGVLTAISVFTSNARGANDPAAARASCRHGLMLAITLGIALYAVAHLVSLHLHIFHQPADVAARTPVFFRIIMLSGIPALGSLALKNHADALNRPWPPFWIFLAGVALNILLNWIMIFGKLGFPALGLEGAGWATLISRTIIFAAMILWLRTAGDLRDWVPHHWFIPPVLHDIRRLLTIGIPSSIQLLFEVSAFSAAGLLIGLVGSSAMAAHQIAITIAGTAFMLPLGLSQALTVRIGEADGAAQPDRLRPIAVSGWLLVAAYAICCALFLVLCGGMIAALFIQTPDVIALTASLLTIVGIFQIADGLQVTSSAMLRGLHDARMPAVIGFISYWIIGLPVGALLAFHFDLGARGIWWGLAIGLATACVTLGPRLWLRTSRANPPA